MFRKHNKKLLAASNPMTRRDFLRLTGFAAATTFIPAEFSRTTQSKFRRQDSAILRVAWEQPVTLDPSNLSSDSEVALVNAVYDYLLDTNASAQLVPRLAQSWSMSDDGLSYTLNLVQNAVFHDGSPFTSADVVWTFDRLRNPDLSSAAGLFGNIVSVEASDPYTVVFALDNTAPDFLYNLTDNRSVMLKAGTEDPAAAFNGTGPYKVTSFDAEDRAILERNEAYWMEGAPTVARLEFIYFGDANASVNALRDGEVDVVLRTPTRVFQSLRSNYNAIAIATNGYNLARLRHDQGFGTDPRVWKAFKLATDRQKIFDIISAGFGAIGNDTPIGPLYADYYDASITLPSADPRAARELLEAAGYPDGIDLDLHVPNSGDRPDLALAFSSFWRDANIRVEIKLRDEGIYYSDVEDNWLQVDLGITGWGSRPTPQQYLDLQLKTDAVWNEAHYSDAELDALIDLAGTSLDQDARVQAYKDIQALLVDRGPIIVPYFFPQFAILETGIDGVQVHPFAGRTDFRFAAKG
ncbi:MAG: ABC transporter substrate-binding protein [Anaerolineales bacterium]|nr:ABC transporter substrate-binding protein [Anaerolineales bacterium]